MDQLDIFNDSRDLQLANALAEALTLDDAAAARRAGTALQAEFPADHHLAPAEVLIAALDAENHAGTSPLKDAAAADAARRHIEQVLAPAAAEVLGRDAAPRWLRMRWQALARRAATLAFDPAAAGSHATAMWLSAAGWQEAATAAQSIESWHRKPVPLAWMAQATWHLAGPDAAWPLLAEVAWRAPQRVPALLGLLPDQRLARLARRFDSAAIDDETDWALWPAWLLVDQPLLSAPLEAARCDGDTAPERTFKTVLSLLRLERAGRHHDIVALRSRLQSQHAGLFAAYMSTR